MKCKRIGCENDFEPKRSTAKFCSNTCRVRDSRDGIVGEVDASPENAIVSLPPEKIKKEITPEQMTPDGQVREVWDKNNPIKNLENGYLHTGQTQEEYIENIPEVGFLHGGVQCEHPAEEQLYSRCMDCGALVPWVKKNKKAILKLKDTKKK